MAEPLRQFFEIYPEDPRGTKPIGMRVNDVVYANGLAGIDLVTGVPVQGIQAQMWLILKHLRSLMVQAGGDLDGVVRCAAYVTNMEDRENIYGPWENLFPDASDRPALKALISELPEGHLVHLDVYGLIGGKRTRIDIPNVHARDPGVVAGNVYFTSRCHGNDQTTGQIVEGGVEAETCQTLENLATLVGLAGGSESDIVQLNMFGRDDSYKEVARRVFEERFPDPAARPVLHQFVNVVSARMQVAIEMMALLPDDAPVRPEGNRKAGGGPRGERFEEVYLCEEGNAKPAGARIGDVVVAPNLAPVDPCSGKLVASDFDGQLAAMFGAVERFLDVSGLGLDDMARLTHYMPELSERLKFNPLWVEWYPDMDNRPPHKYVPSPLPAGVLMVANVIALVGAGPRKCLEVPGVVHNDPMSMGALTGNLVTSSRVVTGSREGGLEEQTALVFANVDAMFRDGGGSFANVTQVTAFVGDAAFGEEVQRAMLALTPAGQAPPVLHVLETNLGGNGYPRLEVLGLM